MHSKHCGNGRSFIFSRNLCTAGAKISEETVPGRLSCFSGIILQGKVHNAVIDCSSLEIGKVNFRERRAPGVYFLKFEFGMDIL